MEVKFYKTEEIEDSLLKYAVIAARYKDGWVWCKNKARGWELPGGRREEDEAITDTAKRELFEETGAVKFIVKPVCAYSINRFGMLYYAEVEEFGALPESEIEEIGFFQDMPDDLSFPLFHPRHFMKAKESLM